MKKCYKCQVEKSLDNFARNKARKDGFQTTCKSCRKIWFKDHYNENKKYYIDKARITRDDKTIIAKTYLISLKDNKPCTDCKISYPHYVMDFDHLFDKKYNIAQMKGSGFTLEAIKQEIAKCELVCSNCHRIRTWNRRYPR